MTIHVRPLGGAEVTAALDDLAALRIAVFAAWPYLYDGDRAYEADYSGNMPPRPARCWSPR
jgi:hypothetical protein